MATTLDRDKLLYFTLGRGSINVEYSCHGLRWLLQMETDGQVPHRRIDSVNDYHQNGGTLHENIGDKFNNFRIDVDNYYTLPAI